MLKEESIGPPTAGTDDASKPRVKSKAVPNTIGSAKVLNTSLPLMELAVTVNPSAVGVMNGPKRESDWARTRSMTVESLLGRTRLRLVWIWDHEAPWLSQPSRSCIGQLVFMLQGIFMLIISHLSPYLFFRFWLGTHTLCSASIKSFLDCDPLMLEAAALGCFGEGLMLGSLCLSTACGAGWVHLDGRLRRLLGGKKSGDDEQSLHVQLSTSAGLT